MPLLSAQQSTVYSPVEIVHYMYICNRRAIHLRVLTGATSGFQGLTPFGLKPQGLTPFMAPPDARTTSKASAGALLYKSPRK